MGIVRSAEGAPLNADVHGRGFAGMEASASSERRSGNNQLHSEIAKLLSVYCLLLM